MCPAPDQQFGAHLLSVAMHVCVGFSTIIVLLCLVESYLMTVWRTTSSLSISLSCFKQIVKLNLISTGAWMWGGCVSADHQWCSHCLLCVSLVIILSTWWCENCTRVRSWATWFSIKKNSAATWLKKDNSTQAPFFFFVLFFFSPVAALLSSEGCENYFVNSKCLAALCNEIWHFIILFWLLYLQRQRQYWSSHLPLFTCL